MKIAIVAHALHTGGGYSLAINFVRTLKKVACDEEFLIVCPQGVGYEEIDLPANCELIVYESSHTPLRRYLFDEFELPKILGGYNPDVLFAMGNVGLRRPSSRQAVFFQQAYLLYNHRHYPNNPPMSWIRMIYLDLQIRNRLGRTDLIFCQTPIVKERFVNKYSYPEQQIKIWRFAPPPEIKPAGETDKPALFCNAEDYFNVLVLTRYLIHRNPSILIPLCNQYGRQIRKRNIRFITTIKPSSGRHANRFLKNIVGNNLKDLIINVGHLTRQEVSNYLTFSNVLWIPTLLETLCVPYLEAMMVGTPIIAPDLDFARYVCGDAAVYYNPWDLDSIFRNIILIRDNPGMGAELVRKGKGELEKDNKFAKNWEEVATAALSELREIVAKR